VWVEKIAMKKKKVVTCTKQQVTNQIYPHSKIMQISKLTFPKQKRPLWALLFIIQI